jgi:hypothetical protein
VPIFRQCPTDVELRELTSQGVSGHPADSFVVSMHGGDGAHCYGVTATIERTFDSTPKPQGGTANAAASGH